VDVKEIIENITKKGYEMKLTDRGTIILTHNTATEEEAAAVKEKIRQHKAEIITYLKGQELPLKKRQQLIEDRFNEAIEELKQEYPEGAFEWCAVNRPGLDKRLNGAEKAIHQAWQQGNIERFNQALAEYKDVVNKIYTSYTKLTGKKVKVNPVPAKPQDPNKKFHQLLISTLTEIEPYRFTDYPLAWAKLHGHTDISYQMFKAETNFNAAVLEKHLEGAKYWSDKLVAGYKQLYEAYRLEIKQLIVSLKVADFELSLTESGLKINYPDPLPEQAQKLYEQLKENTHGVINCLKETEQ